MDTVLDTAVATPLLDTLVLVTAVDTTEDSAMAVATMESVRLRLSPSTDTLAWATLVLTPPPPLPPLPSAATAPPPPLVPMSPMVTLPLASTVLTLLEPSTLPRGRLRPSLRLKLRLILTTDTATLELATLA